MRRALVASLVLIVSFCAAPARADIISYELFGTVTSVDTALDLYLPGIEVGVPVQAIVVYGPPTPFDLLTYGIDVFVAGYDICAAGRPLSPSSTTFFWSGTVSLCAGALTQNMVLDLLQLDALSTDPLTLPATLSFRGLDPTCTAFNGCTHTDRPGFSASIDTVASVPDTGSAFLLMLLSVGGLMLIKRTHWGVPV